MSYSTTNQVLKRIRPDAIESLCRTPVDRSYLRELRAACAGEINGYLSVQSCPPVDTFDDTALEAKLREVELALMENELYLSSPTSEAPQRVRDRLKDAHDWLDGIAKRKTTLIHQPGARSMSAELRRGDTQQKLVYRTIEFNWESVAGDDEAKCEHADTGQPYWIADGCGSITGYTVRASGDQANAAVIKPAVNTAVTTDANLIATIWGNDPRRSRGCGGGQRFSEGDAVSVRVIPAAALTEGIDLKVMLRVCYGVTQ